MSKIYILLPVHNRKNITEKFIGCLTSQLYTDYHLVLLDDGSTDGTEEMVRSKITNDFLTVIKGKGNWWWAGALEQGYKWIKKNAANDNDLLLIINDDVVFENDFFKTAHTIFNELNNSLVLAEEYGLQTKQLRFLGENYNSKSVTFNTLDRSNSHEANCFSTRGLFMRVKDFINIGSFYPKLLPHYLSDYEYTYRAYRKGYQFKTFPELKVFVDENISGYKIDLSKGTLKERVVSYFSNKNMAHPVHTLNFILLTSPLPWKVLNLAKLVWKLLKSFLFFNYSLLKDMFRQ